LPMMDRDELLQAHTVAQIMANPRLKILYATYPFQAGQPEAVREAFSNAMGIEAKAYDGIVLPRSTEKSAP